MAVATATAAACGSGDADSVCKQDAERWGKCVGETTDPELGAHIKKELEAKIFECTSDRREVDIARACLKEPTCEAWMACWTRRGKPR